MKRKLKEHLKFLQNKVYNLEKKINLINATLFVADHFEPCECKEGTDKIRILESEAISFKMFSGFDCEGIAIATAYTSQENAKKYKSTIDYYNKQVKNIESKNE